MSESKKLVEVILPIKLASTFTYLLTIDQHIDAAIGKRVVVQFGKRKYYTGIISSIHNNHPAEFQPKAVEKIIDQQALISEVQLEFWQWIADYYLCTIGEVMNAALPAALKLSSESYVVLNPHFKREFALSDQEELLLLALENNDRLSISEIGDALKRKTIIPIVNRLVAIGAVAFYEDLKAQYKPKQEKFISLSEPYSSDERALSAAFDQLSRAKKQEQMLMHFVHLSNNETFLKKADLLKKSNLSAAALKGLIDKGILEEHSVETSRLDKQDLETVEIPELSPSQQNAFSEIRNKWSAQKPILFHGVTSSGKTNVFYHLINETIKQEKQLLYLLPEIALTTQVISRLRQYFGNAVGVYHSRFSDNERVEIWEKTKNGFYKLLIGARSSLFLPFNNLGLVIVDEEHDGSYKQFDPAPRYQARDAAILLAKKMEANIVLASASPSIESYYNCKQAKYELVELHKRFGDLPLPSLELIDLQLAKKQRKLKGQISDYLLEQIKAALSSEKQIILFQNRRGFGFYLNCEQCDWIPTCKNCAVSLTYHQFANALMCHYCGYRITVPKQCKACNEPDLSIKGFGTERIEEELKLLLPTVQISRMDLDSVRGKQGHQRLIQQFENHEIDILVGTQMVSKGLDFDNVSMVGVIDANGLMSFPDFRAIERAFQILLQVSGRSGRKDKQGKVFIQCRDVKHPMFQFLMRHDYKAFYEKQIQERYKLQYPPFVRLVQINLRHKDPEIIKQAAVEFCRLLRPRLRHRMLGPNTPIISRIKNQYIREVLVKIERDPKQIVEIKAALKTASNLLNQMPDYKGVRININVDP